MKLVLVAAVMLLTTSTRLRSQVKDLASGHHSYKRQIFGMVLVLWIALCSSFCLVLGLLSNDPIFALLPDTPVVLPPQFLAQATTN
jgi:hypothetical protein